MSPRPKTMAAFIIYSKSSPAAYETIHILRKHLQGGGVKKFQFLLIFSS